MATSEWCLIEIPTTTREPSEIATYQALKFRLRTWITPLTGPSESTRLKHHLQMGDITLNIFPTLKPWSSYSFPVLSASIHASLSPYCWFAPLNEFASISSQIFSWSSDTMSADTNTWVSSRSSMMNFLSRMLCSSRWRRNCLTVGSLERRKIVLWTDLT